MAKASTEDRDPERRTPLTPVPSEERAPEAPAAARRAPAARPFTVGTAQRIQSAAGNRALAGMIAQRRATAQAPAAPVTESEGLVQPADQVAEHDTAASAQRLVGPEAAAPPEDSATTTAPAGVHQPAPVTAAAPPAPVQRLSRPPASAPAVPATDAGPPVPVQRLSRPPAAASPKFGALKSEVKGKQNTLAAHPPPASKANAAQAAAKAPADDKQAQGKAANAEKMNAAQPGAFDKAAFIAAVSKAIADQAPKNLDEADSFGDSGKADAVKGQVQGRVGQGKEQSAKQIETTTKAAPDTSQAKEKPVTPLTKDPAPANPGTPNPANAVPDKAPASATDFSAGPAQVDQEMAGAQVTEEQLAKSNEPEFTGALKEKKAGEQHAATAPGQVRAAENQTLADAKAGAQASAATSVEAMRGQKAAANNAVGQGQQGAQGKDESKRAQVTAKLQTVFDATQKDVEGILTGLDKKVDDAFSTGEKQARDAFTAEHKRRMDEYKDKRYSGFTGKLKWVKDKFAGLPDEANQIFVSARQGYVTKMQGVISTVADVIGAELNRAKQRIATGRQQLQAEVQKLPADLQAVGKEAAGEFAGKFDELTESVDAKGKELVQTLATKYNEALKSVDAEIDAEKEKNKGLIAKAVDAVKGVIDTILKLKDLLLGVLAKAAQAVMAILKDPIGFLGNLVSAVGAGLKAFMNNIGSHLKKGLIGWLLGSMANAGIQLPDKFDLRGILSMIASLLGLTWGAIRGRIVQKGIPEQAMTAVEAGVPLIGKLQSGGIAGVTEEIKDQVGDLKENLLGKISQYLIPTVLIAGITWIVSLLNPASAFIKACKMIIDIVTFIIDRGAQIIEFVNAVLDAVIAIAGGGAGGVPALIEGALAKSIPVLIGALAAILGIGGIATKVKSFFQALSKPVMKAVDWIVNKIVALGKKIWAKLKAKAKGKGKDGKTGPDGKPDAKAISMDAKSAVERLGRGPFERGEVDAALTPVRGRYPKATITPEDDASATWGVHVQTARADSKTKAFDAKGAHAEILASLSTVQSRAVLSHAQATGGNAYTSMLRMLIPKSAAERERVLAEGYKSLTGPPKGSLKVDKLKADRDRIVVKLNHGIAEEQKRSGDAACNAMRQRFQGWKQDLEKIGDRLADGSGWTEAEEKHVAFQINEIAEKLLAAAMEHGYETADLLKHPSKYAVDGRLKNEYAKDIRTTFYPGFTAATERAVLGRDLPLLIDAKKRHPGLKDQTGYDDDNFFYCKGGGGRAAHIAPAAAASLDHMTPVASHWNAPGHGGSTGSNTHQGKRGQWYNLESNLEVLCGPCNSAKQSGGVKYKPEVGPLFKGPDDP